MDSIGTRVTVESFEFLQRRDIGHYSGDPPRLSTSTGTTLMTLAIASPLRFGISRRFSLTSSPWTGSLLHLRTCCSDARLGFPYIFWPTLAPTSWSCWNGPILDWGWDLDFRILGFTGRAQPNKIYKLSLLHSWPRKGSQLIMLRIGQLLSSRDCQWMPSGKLFHSQTFGNR